MSAQPLLFPSLFALLPPSSYQIITSHLSLSSLHVQPYHLRETIYTPNSSVIPNQKRNLRLQAIYSDSSDLHTSDRKSSKGKGKAASFDTDIDIGKEVGEWTYNLAYLSQPLSGREYLEMNVRAYLGVEIVGKGEERGDVEGFVETLGFVLSHTYERSGLLFHLPLPGTSYTLHLTITRFSPKGGTADALPNPTLGQSSEPYLVQLCPSRPVQSVAGRGEPGIQDMMRMIRDVADRIDGLEWSSGRP